MLFSRGFFSKDPFCFLVSSNFLSSNSSRLFFSSEPLSRFLGENCLSLDLLSLNPRRSLSFKQLFGL